MYLSEIGLILPVDWAHELEVVKKTTRVKRVHEDTETCRGGFRGRAMVQMHRLILGCSNFFNLVKVSQRFSEQKCSWLSLVISPIIVGLIPTGCPIM